MAEKRCSTCKKWKLYIEFHKNKSSKDGYKNQCIACSKKYSYKYYRQNRDRILKYSHKYHQENRDNNLATQQKWREANIEYQREYYSNNRDRKLEYQRKWHQENRDHKLECNREWSKKILNKYELIMLNVEP